jgi:hypothetical protein
MSYPYSHVHLATGCVNTALAEWQHEAPAPAVRARHCCQDTTLPGTGALSRNRFVAQVLTHSSWREYLGTGNLQTTHPYGLPSLLVPCDHPVPSAGQQSPSAHAGVVQMCATGSPLDAPAPPGTACPCSRTLHCHHYCWCSTYAART